MSLNSKNRPAVVTGRSYPSTSSSVLSQDGNTSSSNKILAFRSFVSNWGGGGYTNRILNTQY